MRASRWASRRSTADRTGILASTEALIRQIPGRLVGMTTDLDGQRAFVMTMRAREQDIRATRRPATSARTGAPRARASIYLATIGPHGLRDVAATGAARAAQRLGGARHRRSAAPAPGPYLYRFAVRIPDARAITGACSVAGSLPGAASRTPNPTTPRSPMRSSCAPPS